MKKYLSLLLLLMAAAPAMAQWNTNATPSCIFSTTYVDEAGETKTGGDYYACSPKAARTADKKTWIAWKTWGRKMVNGEPTVAVRTYLQLLDRDGNPQFDEPIMVNDHITPTYWSEYALLAAPDGSAIVTVADSRTEDETYVDEGTSPGSFTPAIYKIDQEGNFLWGLDGVEYRNIINGPYTNAFLVGDDTFFIFVSLSSDNTTGETFIQRIDADGVPAWDEPKKLCDESFLQYKILPSLDGNFLFFDHTADGARVQCLNRDLEDQWGEAVTYDEYHYGGYEMNHYRVVSDGNGGACVAFQRPMGDWSHNIRVQHINADGSLGFGLTGLDAYNAEEFDHNYPSIAVNPKTEEILVQFASSQGTLGCVVHQKFSFDGDYLYPETGMPIATKNSATSGGYFYGLVGLGSLKGGDWIAVYRDLAAFNSESFIIRRYDREGNRVWTRTIGRDIAPERITLIVEEEATYLFYRETKAGKNPGITIFRIGNDGSYNVTYPEEPEPIQGDVNGDGTVDVADIANIINVMATSGNNKAADVNGDGTVDVADIAAIIAIMAGNTD